MATSSSDVPARFDLVLSGGSLSAPVGFVFLDALEPSLPFRTHRAIYGYSPTFIERQNVQGDFGDNQQDFFLTFTQRDWSLGEQQRFVRVGDEDSARRYWRGASVDVTKTPGQVGVGIERGGTIAALIAACPYPDNSGAHAVVTSTTLYSQVPNVATSKGAHGLGAAPYRFGLCTDFTNIYISTTAAGTVGVRKYNGAAFSTFSATAADSLAYLNNTLYGLRNPNGDLVRYDTTGTSSVIFTWKDAAGTAVPHAIGSKIIAFGGKLVILRVLVTGQGELWIYDGTAPTIAARFPPNFQAFDICEALGALFVSGKVTHPGTSSASATSPAVFYYLNGAIGQLWLSADTSPVAPTAVPWRNGILICDPSRQGVPNLIYYNADAGGFSTILQVSALIGTTDYISSGTANSAFFAPTADAGTNGFVFTETGGRKTQAELQTSLIDFGSSLTKYFRGVRVEFDSAIDGDGGAVDVAYRIGDVDGTYTTLATGVTSGAEILFSAVTGKSISIKVTLNTGTSTVGPVLKRISVRAAPTLTSYRTGEYVLDCTGDAGRSPRTLRDGTPNPLAGFESLAQLQIAKASTTPLTVTDRTGTYTGIVEQLEAYEEHPGLDDPTRSGEFVVKLIMRGI